MPDFVPPAVSQPDSARDTFYSKMFWVACAGLFGMLGLGVTGLVYQSGTNAKYGVQIDAMREELKALRETLIANNSSRYTGSDAAMDRKAMNDQMVSMRESWTKMFANEVEMNTLQTRQILELSIFKAKVEERLKIAPAPTP